MKWVVFGICAVAAAEYEYRKRNPVPLTPYQEQRVKAVADSNDEDWTKIVAADSRPQRVVK